MFVSAGAIRDQSRRTGADIESWAAALYSPTASHSLSLGGTQPNRKLPGGSACGTSSWGLSGATHVPNDSNTQDLRENRIRSRLNSMADSITAFGYRLLQLLY